MIRWMIRRDMPEVLHICHLNRLPYTNVILTKKLKERCYVGMVDEREENVVGFMIYEMHKKSIFVTDLVMHPEYVADNLILKLLKKLSPQRRTTVTIDYKENYILGATCVEHGFTVVNKQLVFGETHAV